MLLIDSPWHPDADLEGTILFSDWGASPRFNVLDSARFNLLDIAQARFKCTLFPALII